MNQTNTTGDISIKKKPKFYLMHYTWKTNIINIIAGISRI